MFFFCLFCDTGFGHCRTRRFVAASQPIVDRAVGLAVRDRLHMVTLLPSHNTEELQPVCGECVRGIHTIGTIDTRLQLFERARGGGGGCCKDRTDDCCEKLDELYAERSRARTNTHTNSHQSLSTNYLDKVHGYSLWKHVRNTRAQTNSMNSCVTVLFLLAFGGKKAVLVIRLWDETELEKSPHDNYTDNEMR